jgi:hypothetical protein
MDLTKILTPSNENYAINASFLKLGKFFFTHLISQLEKDLLFIRSQTELPQFSFFNRIRVLHGNIDDNIKKISRDIESEKSYLFLQLPNTAGFLIEEDKQTQSYKMYRATKVNPILNSDLGVQIRPELFVLKSPELEEFKILDESFVRTTISDKTLSIPQMSEMLLLLAESVRE